MNTSSKSFRPSAAVLAAGGFCWVAKFVVIAATDGATSSPADTVTAVLYLSAVALMALGLAALGFAVLAGRHLLLRLAGAVAGAISWALTYVLLETAAQAVVGRSGPSWLFDEIGIVTTGAVLMTVGLTLIRATSPAGGRPHGGRREAPEPAELPRTRRPRQLAGD